MYSEEMLSTLREPLRLVKKRLKPINKGVDTITAIEVQYVERGIDVLKYNKAATCGNYPLVSLLADAVQNVGDKRSAHVEYARAMYGDNVVEHMIKKYNFEL